MSWKVYKPHYSPMYGHLDWFWPGNKQNPEKAGHKGLGEMNYLCYQKVAPPGVLDLPGVIVHYNLSTY